MSIRLQVLENSLKIESMVSNYICTLLDVPPKKSRLFGEKSSALPVNTKIALLLEIDYFDEVMKDKFLKFFEIRNKFAHLEQVIDYTSCFKRIDGIVNKLLKWYPEISPETFKNEENMFHRLYLKLFLEVLGDINRFFEVYKQKIHDEYKIEYQSQFYKHFSDVLYKMAENDPFLLLHLKRAYDITLKEVEELPPIKKSKYLQSLDDEDGK